ncbi:hypothetical protein BDZ45DRAFT_756996 [Acephala macrosclerotiorum]|nr:hypothetical protein BDZ45DRAFT_756996 [Acephala macrosclerotiorum]
MAIDGEKVLDDHQTGVNNSATRRRRQEEGRRVPLASAEPETWAMAMAMSHAILLSSEYAPARILVLVHAHGDLIVDRRRKWLPSSPMSASGTAPPVSSSTPITGKDYDGENVRCQITAKPALLVSSIAPEMVAWVPFGEHHDAYPESRRTLDQSKCAEHRVLMLFGDP